MSLRVHVSVPVSNLEQSIAFYRGLFGTEPSKVRDDYANFRLNEPPIHLALVASGEDATPPGGVHHHGFEVETSEALAAWRARLDDHKVEYRVEDAKVCCYALADKLWVSDPDGNPWELWVRTGDAATMLDTASEEVCCAPEPDAAPAPSEPTTKGGCC